MKNISSTKKSSSQKSQHLDSDSKKSLPQKPRPYLLALSILTLFLIGFVAFWQKSTVYLDPDFGWQIRTGQFILQNGFPQTDPFSYTMPSFHFIPHSWLSDVFIALSYPIIGYGGLGLITSLISSLALIVPALPRFNRWSFILVLLGIASLIPYVGVRPQSVSWLFFAIFMVIIYEKKLWEKFAWILPILMIFWVNVHGGFGAGVALVAFHVAYQTISLKKFRKKEILILGLVVAASFINPYTFNIWKEVLMTFFDDKLRTEVAEWKPLLFRISKFYIPLLAITFVFVAKSFKKLPRDLAVFFVLLTTIAIGSNKMFPLWIITAIYITTRAMLIFEETLIHPESKKRFGIVMKLLAILAISTALVNISRISKAYQHYSEENYYPKKALTYISSKPIAKDKNKNIYTPMMWGGYMLWKLPEKKVFIDGRMTYWTQSYTHLDESVDAFLEEKLLLDLNDYSFHILNKYSIELIMLPKTARLSESYNSFAAQISQYGWQETYEDDVAIIFEQE